MSREVQKLFLLPSVDNGKPKNPLRGKRWRLYILSLAIPLTIIQGFFSYQNQGLALSGLPGLNESRCDVFLKKSNTANRPFG